MTEMIISALANPGHGPDIPATALTQTARSSATEGATMPPVATTGVQQPVDQRHQARIQALARQVQSGQYLVQPQDVAAAWLKAVR